TTFSGLDSRTSTLSFGSVTGIEVVTTGMVIKKMINSTSITSTSGVVLMVAMTASSSPPEEPRFMAIGSGLASRRQDHRVQLVAESAHVVHHTLVAPHEPVVAQHR